MALAHLGRFNESGREAEKALQLNFETPYYAFAALGLIELRNGKREAALEQFRLFDTYFRPEDTYYSLVETWKAEALGMSDESPQP